MIRNVVSVDGGVYSSAAIGRGMSCCCRQMQTVVILCFHELLSLLVLEWDLVRHTHKIACMARVFCDVFTEMKELRDAGRVTGDKDEVGFQ